MNEVSIRAGTFLALVVALLIAERRWPRSRATPDRRHRWPVNFALGAANVATVRLLMPWLAVDAARWGAIHRIGLLHAISLSAVVGGALSVVLLDLAVYAQHVATHKISILWRLHRLHHSDLALDVSSAVRFHPIEIMLSMGLKILVVLALGASPLSVIIFEAALNGFALFTHADIALPAPVDRLLRAVVVTPDMHRIHHSVERAEHDRNYGFQLSLWDRVFRTYLAQPASGPEAIRIGLHDFRSLAEQRLPALLMQPLR